MALPGNLQSLDFTRPTYSADAMGGQSASFAALYTGVSGSFQPASGKTITEFARRSMQISHTFYTETAITLKAGDRAADGNGAYYIVVWFEDQAGQGRIYAAHLLKKD